MAETSLQASWRAFLQALKLSREGDEEQRAEAEVFTELRDAVLGIRGREQSGSELYRRGAQNLTMPEDLEQIARDVQMRLALVEEKLRGSYADRDWVRDFTEPTRVAVVEIKGSMQTMTAEMKSLGDKVGSVFAAHDTFLEEKRQAEKQAAEDAKPLGLIRKYTPVGTLLVLIVALFRIMGSLAEYWIASLPKK